MWRHLSLILILAAISACDAPSNTVTPADLFGRDIHVDTSDISDTVMSHASDSPPETHFVTTWNTRNVPDDVSTVDHTPLTRSQITIPVGKGRFNYDVDWDNDGIFDDIGLTDQVTHDFGQPGTYTIRIRGEFPHIRFTDRHNAARIISMALSIKPEKEGNIRLA